MSDLELERNELFSMPQDYGTIVYPPRLTDRAGHRVRPGSTVRLNDGRTGEVASWRGEDLLEVLVDGPVTLAPMPDEMGKESDGDGVDADGPFAGDIRDIVVVHSTEVDVVAAIRTNAMTLGAMPIEVTEDGRSERRVVVVLPVGGQDVKARAVEGGRILPDAEDFSSRRGRAPEPGERDSRQVKVDARRFGEACLDALQPLIEQSGEEAANAVVARELDAPMLRRVLEETVLPRRIDRLVLVGSEQDEAIPFAVDDTAAFSRLLERWVRGTEAIRRRTVGTIDFVTIRREPHRVDFVIEQVAEAIRRFSADADEVVVVQAGGTPSMTFGVLMAAIAEGTAPVRHVQVPIGQPLVEIDVVTGEFNGRLRGKGT